MEIQPYHKTQPHCPPLHSWNASNFWDHGKNAMQKLRDHRSPSFNPAAHFELWCTSLVFMTAESSCKCLKRRGDGNQIRTAKQTHDLKSSPLLTQLAQAEKFHLSKGKSQTCRRIIWEILHLLSPQLLTSSHQLHSPNSLPRRWKPLTIKCLFSLWVQILLQWPYRVFWTQNHHWC